MKRLLAAASLASLAACATPVTYDGPALAEAPLPDLHAGDSLTWSSGVTETVASVDGEVVDWRDDHGNTFRSYRNFLLPSLAWDYPRTSALTRVDAPASLLWPLSTGRQAWFTVDQKLTVKPHFSEVEYQDEWSCDVQGTERVTTVLGRFDTYRLRCARYWHGGNLGEVVWNYAPDLKTVVRRRFPGQDRPEELVALRRGTVPANLDAVVEPLRQQALEGESSEIGLGRAIGQAAVSVTPLATWRDAQGGFCRRLRETVAAPGGRIDRLAAACRDRYGLWRVVAAAMPMR